MTALPWVRLWLSQWLSKCTDSATLLAFPWMQQWSSRRAQAKTLLASGIKLARENQPDLALKAYNQVLRSWAAAGDVRAIALFNRALVRFKAKDPASALADLRTVVVLPGVPQAVRTAAEQRLAYVQRMSRRRTSMQTDPHD